MRPTLPIDATLLKPGLRLAVGLSGGADSVALLRALAERSGELGLVLHAAHLHHGLRGAEADLDLEFARALAAELGLVFHEARVETAVESAQNGESIEEAARRLRYGWFRQLMASGEVEAVATAHTRDDQAETVLGKFLRGAWTEGMSGIHPVVEFKEGRILRPLLGATRVEVEAYLRELGQGWREDSSNRHLTFTRNRLRHELLPLLEGWNPRLREHLAQMAALARDEEAWWQGEMARLAGQLLLPGRPARGGGRAAGDGLGLDVTRLAALAPAVQRRLLRYAAGQLGATPDFLSTEALRALAFTGRAGQKCELAQGLRAERTPRELRLRVGTAAEASKVTPEYSGTIPGEIVAPAFGLRLRIEVSSPQAVAEAAAEKGGTSSKPPERHPSGAKAPYHFSDPTYGLKPVPFTGAGLSDPTYGLKPVPFTEAGLPAGSESHPTGLKPVPFTEAGLPAGSESHPTGLKPVPFTGAGLSASSENHPQETGRVATLRNWRAGDRVKLRHSGGPRKVKEVLERLRVTGSGRALWPVLDVSGRIVWMQGVELEPEEGIHVAASPLEAAAPEAICPEPSKSETPGNG
jgi:tRNA(Ile)-lysidine synthase